MFKENVRLNEALGYHIKEVEELGRMTVTLTEENASLALHKVHWHGLALHKVHWHGQGKQSRRRFHDLALPCRSTEQPLMNS